MEKAGRCASSRIESCSSNMFRLVCMLILVALALLGVEASVLITGGERSALITFVNLVLIIILFVGLITVKHLAIKRMDAIAETAERIIATGDLSQRIPIDRKWKDLSNLSALLNRMLEEIEQHLNSVRTVSDNIAHDLRTPLTRLRNHIEMLRLNATATATPEQQQAEFSELMGECDALLTTFSALLRISNIESARRQAQLREVNLKSLIADVVELYEPIAAEKNITLSLTEHPLHAMQVTGDKDLLFQAFANLVDNAVKYTPDGGRITITTHPQQHGGRVEIRDTGRGIEDAHKPNVFRRFYRVEASRSQPGSGLGLSLVAAIIKLHHGSITLSDNDPSGLTVSVAL